MKYKKLLLFLTLIIFTSCNSSKDVVAEGERFDIKSLEGLTAVEILNTYPDANIYEDIILENGIERPYFVLYRDTPDELHILWSDNSKNEIHDIRFSNEGNWKVAKNDNERVSSL